jgi:hypothetical protein
MRGIVIASAIAFAVLTPRAHAAGSAPFCVVGSLNFGSPDCNYRTWEQCRAALGGVGDYCEPNTRSHYVFDLRDPAHPRARVDTAPPRYRYRW